VGSDNIMFIKNLNLLNLGFYVMVILKI